MYLKSLSLNGFKTFADKVDFVFKPGATAIVGPNGSGKSNIFDAIIWVLGDQNMRSIRGKKMEEVIFHGSEGRKQRGLAQVTLTFDNEDQYIPIPHSELSITRRYYRNGDSEFLINNESCRLKDIQGLFMDTGLGKLNYSIVTQGDIDYLVGLSPMERRAIFDEAAGVNKFKQEKKRVQNKIKETEANLARLKDLQHELEERLVTLEEQAHAAKKWNELNGQILDLRKRILVMDIRKWREQIQEFNTEELKLKEAIAASTEQIASASTQRGDLQASIVKEETLLDRERDEASALQARIGREKEAQKFLGMQAEQLKTRKEKTEYDIKAKKLRISAIDDEMKDGEVKIRASEMNLAEKEKALKTMAPPDAADADAVQPLNASLEDLSAELSEKEEARRQADAARQATKHEEQGLRGEVERARRKMGDQQSQLENLEKKLSDTGGKSRQLEEKAAGIDAQLAECEASLGPVQEERDARASEFSAARERLRSLNAQRDHLSKLVHKARKNAEEKKDSKGAASGPMPPAFAESVKPKAGQEKLARRVMAPYRQSLVVADFQEAKAFLAANAKEGESGSLLVLETAGSVPAGLKADKSVKGTAADCLSFSGPLAAKLKSFFEAILIVDTPDAGKALADAGARAIAQSGDWAFEGGLLHFGEPDTAIEDLLATLEAAEKEIESCRDELKAAESAESKARSELDRLKNRIRQLTTDREATAKALASENSGRAVDVNRVEFLKQEIAAAAEVIAEAERRLGGMAAALQKAENGFAKADADFRTVKEKEQALLRQVQAINRERAEKEQAWNDARIQVIESRQAIETEKQAGRMLNEEKERLKDELDSMNQNLGSIEGDIARNAEQIASKNSEVGALTEQEAKKGLELGARRSRVAELRDRLERHEEGLSRLRDKISDAKESLGQTEIKKSRTEVMLEEALNAIHEEYPSLGEADILNMPVQVAMGEKTRLKEYREQKESLEPVNHLAISEFAEARMRFDETEKQMDDCEKTKQYLIETMEDFDRRSLEKFLSAFHIIREHFYETFQEVFQGGEANLFMLDPENPLETGIQVEVQIPGKKKTSLSLLSGGEKALCTLTLIFAILKYKPSPFYLLDEVDAGLDEANVVKFRNLIANYSKKLQFLLVSHNKGTLAGMDHFYGITMQESGISKVLSVTLAQAQAQKTA